MICLFYCIILTKLSVKMSRTLLSCLRLPRSTFSPSLKQSSIFLPVYHPILSPVHHHLQSRGILTPSTPPPARTSAEVVRALSQDIIGGPSNYDPDLYDKKREELLKILPRSQSELPPRRMLDSYDSALIPIASDPSLRDHYTTYDGGVRRGRLLEDMDYFAVHLGIESVEDIINLAYSLFLSVQACSESSSERLARQPSLYSNSSGGSD